MKRSILVLLVILAACVGGVLGSLITLRYLDFQTPTYQSIDARQQSALTNYVRDTSYHAPEGLNFLDAASKVTSGVVHIRTSFGPGDFSVNPLELYFEPPSRSSGSGVIISDDGYIVTNYHVIEDAHGI